jgi:L-ascorbate metabolism protein UlaG (beta-lactamase superfamily)
MTDTVVTPHPAASDQLGEGPGSLLFIGNATTLIRLGPFTILTDPTFVHRHESVDLGPGLSSRRLTDPALEIDELPPVDLVLLSHFHGDHFDQVAQERLDKELPVVTTPQARKELESLGFRRVTGLDTWESATVPKAGTELRITACPGRHGPGLVDLVLPDVMGSVLELVGDSTSPRVYVSGDTLVFDGLQEIARRYPELDVAVLHLGGTKVLGILVTMDAEQGVEAVRRLQPDVVLPVHFDDFDVFTSPLSDFLQEAERAGFGDRVVPLERGARHDFLPRQ